MKSKSLIFVFAQVAAPPSKQVVVPTGTSQVTTVPVSPKAATAVRSVGHSKVILGSIQSELKVTKPIPNDSPLLVGEQIVIVAFTACSDTS